METPLPEGPYPGPPWPGTHLHSLGLDPHHAATLLLDLDVLRYHTLLRRHDLLRQDAQYLVLPLQHLLQYRVLQVDCSEKRKGW